MLEIRKIKKEYQIGEQIFPALKGIDLSFRKQEFVAILGHSGSGKTTLLNIIGGLDRYDSGDLIIDHVSTKNYKDKEWDAYRNHRIGFVFQNYNLIPHLDILSNVELAQTLSGVSREERKRRATEVLTRVGLFDHIHKRPSQLSGGQQQRVSIARALVNNPSIILADEPTGALDSETSVDIMNLLTEISQDKLIIMVTHNGELAKKYASRTVMLKDGLVISDTNPFDEAQDIEKRPPIKKTSMSFLTALRLSFKNLLTKKVRTLITALAGSIGIIGVALVMSLQHGFNSYLSNMEQDTFAGLPITVNRKYMDLSFITPGQNPFDNDDIEPVDNGIGGYDPTLQIPQIYKTNIITEEYIDYLKDPENKLDDYASVVYNYGFVGHYFYRTNDGVNHHGAANTSGSGVGGSTYIRQSAYTMEFMERYFDIVAGDMYENNAYQAVLIVDENNRVPNELLNFLGYDTSDPNMIISYNDILNKEFKAYTNDAYYREVTESNYSKKGPSDLVAVYDANDSDTLTIDIVGIIKVNNEFIQAREQIIFSDAVAEYIIEKNKNSDIVAAQIANPGSNVDMDGTDFGPAPGFIPGNMYGLADSLQDLGASDIPVSISIYPKNFDSKEEIIQIINGYNDRFEADDDVNRIQYTDNVASALSMIKTVMNSISAVLIAFSSISLFVSSVMIGIITYTSVLERTKEIGVLRSIGARKKDISRVFNAEAILIGFTAGVLGVVITYGLVPIANIFLRDATEGVDVADLFIGDALMLIVISIALTFIAGLIPSRIAAKKDPVVALRTE